MTISFHQPANAPEAAPFCVKIGDRDYNLHVTREQFAVYVGDDEKPMLTGNNLFSNTQAQNIAWHIGLDDSEVEAFGVWFLRITRYVAGRVNAPKPELWAVVHTGEE